MTYYTTPFQESHKVSILSETTYLPKPTLIQYN